MEIRHTTTADLATIEQIYAGARAFMAEHGNPNQWGPTNWPPMTLIEEDIAAGRSYVCTEAGRVVGTFCYLYGPDIEPTYRVITDGAWLDESPYGVIHRLAGDGSVKGIGAYCINWALAQHPHMRVDTHTDNVVMQNLLTRLGFTQCGIIHVVEDNYPRYAYERR